MKSVKEVIRDETGKILRDRVVIIYLLLFPLLGLLAYGVLFSKRVGRDYPVAIVDQEISYGSRFAMNYIESTPELKVFSVVRSKEEAMAEMREGKVAAIIFLPSSLESDLKSRKPIRVDVLVDARNMINANFILTSLQKALGYGQAGIKFLVYGKLFPKDEAKRMLLPVRFHSHALGNPTVDYSFFVFTGIVIMLIQQCLLVGSALGVTGEIESGALALTIAEDGGVARYLSLRQLIYTVIQIPVILILLSVYFFVFKMPSANVLPLILFLILFSSTVIALSQAMGVLFTNKKTLLQALLFFPMPVFFLSGYTWPVEGMAPGLGLISALLPTTPILKTWTMLTNVPDSLRYLGGTYLHQILLIVFYFALGCFCLWIRISKERKKSGANRIAVKDN